MHNKTNRKGFTLVEIMIVVVIIGLLAAMAIPAFNKVRFESRKKAVVNNLRQIASGAQQYMLDKSVTQVAALTDLVGTATDAYVRTLSAVGGEDYSSLFPIEQGDSQLSITGGGLGSEAITYNF